MAVTSNLYPWLSACQDKSMGTFWPVLRAYWWWSWSVGRALEKVQILKGPQNWVLGHFQSSSSFQWIVSLYWHPSYIYTSYYIRYSCPFIRTCRSSSCSWRWESCGMGTWWRKILWVGECMCESLSTQVLVSASLLMHSKTLGGSLAHAITGQPVMTANESGRVSLTH